MVAKITISQWLASLPDPDMVGASEYRAIHEVLVDGLISELYAAEFPDSETEAERVELARGILDEFIQHAQVLKRSLQQEWTWPHCGRAYELVLPEDANSTVLQNPPVCPSDDCPSRELQMGQYWHAVNLDKREFVSAHQLGHGVKLWEHLANHPGTGAALIILCAAMPEPRGGGDFDLTENWHGPERTFPEHATTPGPMPPSYAEIAKRTIGRWAGDRIALVGDYAEDSDLAPEHHASKIWDWCSDEPEDPNGSYTNITDDVGKVIEHELGGRFVETGWGGKRWEEPK